MNTLKNHPIFLSLEMLLLFFVIPVMPLFEIPLYVVMPLMILAVIYTIALSIKLGYVTRESFGLNGFKSWGSMLGLFAIFALLSAVLMYFFEREEFFRVVLAKPGLWFLIWFVYAFFSVIPQETVYRSFYYNRYKPILGSGVLAIFANALAFANAHAFLNHWLVFSLTFAGGILFSITYLKHRSITVISIQHTLYGLWLFTVGLGKYFAFPG